MTNNKINNFLDWYHNNDYGGFLDIDVNEYLTKIHEAISFFKQEPRKGVSASMLGKPLITLAIKKLGLPFQEQKITPKTLTIFHYGHLFEGFITTLLKSKGFTITDDQLTVVHNDYPKYKGHIDGILDGDTLLEVKTMNSSYFNRFTKAPDNLRGYYSQLAFYFYGLVHQGVLIDKCVWLCINKETYEIAFVQPDYSVLDRFYEDLTDKIEKLESIYRLEDLLSIPLPEPRIEIYKGNPTGKFLPPQSFRHHPYYECFFNTFEEVNNYKKETTYVDLINSPSPEEILYRLEQKISYLAN